MPHPRPSSKTSDTQKRITNVIDHTNLDDFFSQPSPHELTATSERRVQEVIEDLKRQTVEELKNWSWSPSDDKKFKAFKFFDDSTEKTSIISDRDMVSFPVSLPTVSSSSSTESNCPAAISIEPKIQSYTKSGRSTYTRCGASSSSPQDQLLRTSDGRHESRRPTTKPSNLTDLDNTSSRPSNVRSRAKIPPPIPIIARHFARECPRTPLEDPRTPPLPPPVTPATPGAALQHITQHERMFASSGTISPASARFSVSDRQTLDMLMKGWNARDTIKSFPPAHARASSVAPLGIKRKPLPADSPLLVGLDAHPAFAKTAPGPGRDGLWM